jgi:hypothetical protein
MVNLSFKNLRVLVRTLKVPVCSREYQKSPRPVSVSGLSRHVTTAFLNLHHATININPANNVRMPNESMISVVV